MLHIYKTIRKKLVFYLPYEIAEFLMKKTKFKSIDRIRFQHIHI